MVQRRGGVRFLFEAGAPGLIAGDIPGQDLERDLASQASVASAIHFAHTARAERGDDLIRTQAGAR